MKSVLITGSNGLLGQKLIQFLVNQHDCRVIATSRNPDRIIHLKGYQFELLDITNAVEVDYIILKYKPDVIINTAALTQVDFCEDNKAECWSINVEAVRNILNIADKINAFFIQLSTDFIFDGYSGPYSETDEPNPLSYYGLSKLESEKLVQSMLKKWSIIRTILVYGVTGNMSRSNIVLWVKESLENNKPIQVVNDQFRAPTLAEDLARACGKVALKEKNGIYHISGQQLMSILDIAYMVADFFKLDQSMISPVNTVDLNEKAKRPFRTGFILEKARIELDYTPHTFWEGLEIVSKQLINLM
jgi:dTDP-4-dehydrorhamnose reductase